MLLESEDGTEARDDNQIAIAATVVVFSYAGRQAR